MTSFEYRVCMVQSSRVTWVNGRWEGSIGIERGDPQRALDSCPQLWDYLNTAGSEGWQMTGAVNGTVTHGQETSSLTSYVFLSRQR
jgi:hypothetical protein